MSHSFFALLSRMKYIHRWALMRNAREENLSEHCLEVGILTHALCLIGNKKLNKKLSVDRAVLRALYPKRRDLAASRVPVLPRPLRRGLYTPRNIRKNRHLVKPLHGETNIPLFPPLYYIVFLQTARKAFPPRNGLPEWTFFAIK